MIHRSIKIEFNGFGFLFGQEMLQSGSASQRILDVWFVRGLVWHRLYVSGHILCLIEQRIAPRNESFAVKVERSIVTQGFAEHAGSRDHPCPVPVWLLGRHPPVQKWVLFLITTDGSVVRNKTVQHEWILFVSTLSFLDCSIETELVNRRGRVGVVIVINLSTYARSSILERLQWCRCFSRW